MERVGELKLLKRLTKELQPATRAELSLSAAVADVVMNPATKDDAAFLARFLVQCTLPHSDPCIQRVHVDGQWKLVNAIVPMWSRRNGGVTLSIVPGLNTATGKSFGYPYGSIPRLLLYWMTTEVQRTKHRADLTPIEKRRIQLGHSLSKFMRELGLNPYTGRGKRGDAKRLRNQMERLFNSIFSLDETFASPDRQGHAWVKMQVAPKGELWWNPKQPQQDALWGSWIELSEDFYNALCTAVVPADIRTLRALKGSPLALDLYALLNYVGATTKASKFISWTMLQQQLGTDVKNVDDFRKNALVALRKVKLFLGSKGANITHDTKKGGLLIAPGRPAIPKSAG